MIKPDSHVNALLDRSSPPAKRLVVTDTHDSNFLEVNVEL